MKAPEPEPEPESDSDSDAPPMEVVTKKAPQRGRPPKAPKSSKSAAEELGLAVPPAISPRKTRRQRRESSPSRLSSSRSLNRRRRLRQDSRQSERQRPRRRRRLRRNVPRDLENKTTSLISSEPRVEPLLLYTQRDTSTKVERFWLIRQRSHRPSPYLGLAPCFNPGCPRLRLHRRPSLSMYSFAPCFLPHSVCDRG